MRTCISSLLLLITAAGGWLGAPRTIAPEPTVPSAPDRQAIVRRADKSLAWADRESLAAVSRHLAALDTLFADAKHGTPDFAKIVLGWGSKWRFVADKVPFTKGGRHEAFLRRTFDDHLFRPEELSQAVEQAARGYGDELVAIENQMLVRLREDLDDLPTSAAPRLSDPARLAEAYQRAIDRALGRVGAEVTADVATLIVSIVTQEVLTQVAVRMGVSAGVLGAGAATSWATLGAGLVIGLIVDQVIAWVWDWWADPRGCLAAEMTARLDQLRLLIVDGDDQSPGLRRTLEEFARRRAEIRRQAVLSLL